MFFQVVGNGRDLYLKNTQPPIMKSIFITRNISPNSVFVKQLKERPFHISGQSFIEFSPVAFESFPTTDWIFFYSRKAVSFFAKQLTNIPQKVKYAAMGQGTAEEMNRYHFPIHFVGAGEGSRTSKAFFKKANQQSVLFPQAKNSRQTIQELLDGQLEMHSLIVYDNQIIDNIPLIDANILIFTSPMNVQAYFSTHSLLDHQQVIAIGSTTAEALRSFDIEDVKVARVPSEEGLAEAVKEYRISST